MSRKFCALENWRPPEQTWMSEWEKFRGHQFVLHFEYEFVFVGHYFALNFEFVTLFVINDERC